MNVIGVSSPFVCLPIVIRALRGAVGGWVGPGMLSIPLVVLLFRRLGEICARMERMTARFEAGRLWRRGPRVVPDGCAAEVENATAEATRARAERIWPVRFGWLLKIASYRAAVYGSQLRVILEQPDMIAFLAAAPQAAGVLRPLCRMLGVETSLLRRRPDGSLEPETIKVAAVEKKRVRKKRAPVDWGRIPLPRGLLTWSRKQGFGKLPKD